MVAWDMTEKDKPKLYVYCDNCGKDITAGYKHSMRLDNKHYCNRCLFEFGYQEGIKNVSTQD